MDPAGDANDFVAAGQFQIGFDRDGLHQQFDVAVLNVPTIFAEVKRDPVSAALFGERRSDHWIRLVGSTSLSHGRHVVNVDSQFDHSLRSRLNARIDFDSLAVGIPAIHFQVFWVHRLAAEDLHRHLSGILHLHHITTFLIVQVRGDLIVHAYGHPLDVIILDCQR